MHCPQEMNLWTQSHMLPEQSVVKFGLFMQTPQKKALLIYQIKAVVRWGFKSNCIFHPSVVQSD